MNLAPVARSRSVATRLLPAYLEPGVRSRSSAIHWRSNRSVLMRPWLCRRTPTVSLSRMLRSVLAGSVAVAFAPTLLAQAAGSSDDLKAQVAQMRQQMEAQQQVMQKMQQRLSELEAREAAQ